MAALRDPTAGLILSKKKSSDGNSVYILITTTEERYDLQAELTKMHIQLKVLIDEFNSIIPCPA
jgi:hypothetical protein